jgi:3-deoxy-manno-octulosonate cytidylyltransferase (CMP-KDO synthetase)
MLALINGKPLIYWTWRQAKKARLLDEVVVATESREVFDVVQGFGGKAVIASGDHASGTERVAEAARQFPWGRYVINVQGDEPLLPSAAIDAVIRTLLNDSKICVATAATPFRDRRETRDPSNGKVILNRISDALYFSRAVIPFPRFPFRKFLKHIGIYGFRRDFLYDYVRMRPTPLEKAERLEQLRILEHGYPVRVVVGRFHSISVDTPADLARVRRAMKHG